MYKERCEAELSLLTYLFIDEIRNSKLQVLGYRFKMEICIQSGTWKLRCIFGRSSRWIRESFCLYNIELKLIVMEIIHHLGLKSSTLYKNKCSLANLVGMCGEAFGSARLCLLHSVYWIYIYTSLDVSEPLRFLTNEVQFVEFRGP